MDALKSIYGQEKQFTVSSFLEHFMSLECNGCSDRIRLNSNGDLFAIKLMMMVDEAGAQNEPRLCT